MLETGIQNEMAREDGGFEANINGEIEGNWKRSAGEPSNHRESRQRVKPR